jgi:hypothetical protein
LSDIEKDPPDLQLMVLPSGISSDGGVHLWKALGVSDKVPQLYWLFVLLLSGIQLIVLCNRIQNEKVFPTHTIKAYQWRGCIAPIIHTISTKWRQVVSLMPWQLKSALCRSLARSQRRCGYFGEERSLLHLLGFKSCIVQPVAQ